jgi:hypothetical protein
VKELKCGLDPRIEGGNRRLQLFNGFQMLADQEAMVVANATVQGIGKLTASGGQTWTAELG